MVYRGNKDLAFKKRIFFQHWVLIIFLETYSNRAARYGSGLYLVATDLAKIYYLFLKDGNWNGKQL